MVVFCFDSKTSFYLSISGHFVFHENPDIPHYIARHGLEVLVGVWRSLGSQNHWIKVSECSETPKIQEFFKNKN